MAIHLFLQIYTLGSQQESLIRRKARPNQIGGMSTTPHLFYRHNLFYHETRVVINCMLHFLVPSDASKATLRH